MEGKSLVLKAKAVSRVDLAEMSKKYKYKNKNL